MTEYRFVREETKEQIARRFASMTKKRYQKRGRFLFRRADPGETVLTIVSGRLETMKTAGDSDIVLRNIEIGSSAECYIISKEKFDERYRLADMRTVTIDGKHWDVADAKGQVDAAEYAGDEEIHFTAPWGEPMVLSNGDFLARPVNGSEEDIYRIERSTFEMTYSEIQSTS